MSKNGEEKNDSAKPGEETHKEEHHEHHKHDDIPIEATGDDQEIDFTVTETEVLNMVHDMKKEHSEDEREVDHKLGDALKDFASKIAEGARNISHHWAEEWVEGEATVTNVSGPSNDGKEKDKAQV